MEFIRIFFIPFTLTQNLPLKSQYIDLTIRIRIPSFPPYKVTYYRQNCIRKWIFSYKSGKIDCHFRIVLANYDLNRKKYRYSYNQAETWKTPGCLNPIPN